MSGAPVSDPVTIGAFDVAGSALSVLGSWSGRMGSENIQRSDAKSVP
jgi:hypothetical protein